MFKQSRPVSAVSIHICAAAVLKLMRRPPTTTMTMSAGCTSFKLEKCLIESMVTDSSHSYIYIMAGWLEISYWEMSSRARTHTAPVWVRTSIE